MSSPKKSAAGDFPFRMTVLRDVGTTQDAAGHPTPDWQPYFKVWGGEEITSGREFVDARQVRAETTSIVKTRFDRRLMEKMQLVPKQGSSRRLEIIAAINKGSFNVEWELWCKEAK